MKVMKANWAFSNRECSVIGFLRTCVSLSSGSSHRCSVSFPPNRRIRCMDAAGLDSNGREFKSPDEMWTEQAGDPNKKTLWYRNGVSYWEGVEASMDGVLGGFANVNEPDIKCSEEFLKIILSERFPADARHQPLVALDCGSGIGRITKNLLIRHFNEVDLLEPVSHFLEAARQTLGPENHMNSDTHKAVNFYCVPLQDFTPESGRYDVIWIQWCIGHLTDDDFVSFFKRAKVGLKPGGLFILKENLARSGFVLDNDDRSVTRSDLYFKELFSRCGLHVYKSKVFKTKCACRGSGLNILEHPCVDIYLEFAIQPLNRSRSGLWQICTAMPVSRNILFPSRHLQGHHYYVTTTTRKQILTLQNLS